MIDLDHVALATRRHRAAPSTSSSASSAGRCFSGGNGVGFRPCRCAGRCHGGMNVELLEPWDVEAQRLPRAVPRPPRAGPHHLTFKVDDLAATLERVAAAGFTPVNVDLSRPALEGGVPHPREAHGTVVQLAEASRLPGARRSCSPRSRRHGADGQPQWWPDPPPRGDRTPVLRRVVVSPRPSLPAAVGFFAGAARRARSTPARAGSSSAGRGGGRVRSRTVPGRRRRRPSSRPRWSAPGLTR